MSDKSIEDIVTEQGWDDGALISLLYEYIDNQGSMDVLADFLAEKAREENEADAPCADAAIPALRVGDRVRVSEEGAAHVGFEGEREGRILRFGTNCGDRDALLDGGSDEDAGARWALVKHLTRIL